MENNKYDYEELLQVDEFKVYKKILKEIEENKQFYLSITAQEMADTLIENCQIDKKDLYTIIKKINLNQ